MKLNVQYSLGLKVSFAVNVAPGRANLVEYVFFWGLSLPALPGRARGRAIFPTAGNQGTLLGTVSCVFGTFQSRFGLRPHHFQLLGN